jgi:hypothetical protein
VFQQAMAQEQEHFQRQEAQTQQQVDAFSRALRGVTLTSDPVDHTRREVWTGPNANYFINPAGHGGECGGVARERVPQIESGELKSHPDPLSTRSSSAAVTE